VRRNDLEIPRRRIEEPRQLLKQLRREDPKLLWTAAVNEELLGEIARVVEVLVVALRDDTARIGEETEEVFDLDE
jgi:hypothetical protein